MTHRVQLAARGWAALHGRRPRLASRAPSLAHLPTPSAPRAAVAGGVRGNLLQAARAVVAAGGVRALYRGFRASLLGDVMGNALGFTAYEIGNR